MRDQVRFRDCRSKSDGNKYQISITKPKNQ
jgi:hypothetical protein